MDVAKDDLTPRIGRVGIFTDLDSDELRSVSRRARQRVYGEGEWVLRRGTASPGLFVIVAGEAGVIIDDTDVARLSTGSFFGEVSTFIGEPTTADVIARTRLLCLLIEADQVQRFLLDHPEVMFRMLQTQARRLRASSLERN